MTCEDKQVYAYDGEELHLVATSWEQLLKEGIQYPADTSYYNGEAFKDTDWDEVRKGDVGRRLDQEHLKLVTANKSELLWNLRAIKAEPTSQIQYYAVSLAAPTAVTRGNFKLQSSALRPVSTTGTSMYLVQC